MVTYFRAEFHISMNSVEVDDSQLDYPTQNPVIDGAVEEFLANEKMGENILYPMTQLSYILDQEYTVILSYADEVTVEGFKDLLYGASPDGNAPDGWMEGNIYIGPFWDGDEYEIIPTLSHLWQYTGQDTTFQEKDWFEIDLHALQPTLY